MPMPIYLDGQGLCTWTFLKRVIGVWVDEEQDNEDGAFLFALAGRKRELYL